MTCFHEAWHACQPKDLEQVDREVEARVKEMEFLLSLPKDLREQAPQKYKDQITKDDKIDIEKIKEIVRRQYPKTKNAKTEDLIRFYETPEDITFPFGTRKKGGNYVIVGNPKQVDFK